MFYKSKEINEEKVYELKQVEIWRCPECIGWMQKEFSVAENPICPFCSSNMVSGLREINVLLE